MLERQCDVLIAGAGPAGLAARHAALRHGRKVTILDDNPAPGGQIWRGRDFPGVEMLHGPAVWVDASERSVLFAGVGGGTSSLRYQKLILATGARERFLPFPGWTLPGVFGAGGLQALVKSGFPVEGKRIVVAGTGPLLLAVAAYLKERGAEVVRIAEQADGERIHRFARSLATRPSKLLQGLLLRGKLLGTPYTTSCWPLRAEGSSRITSVRLRGEKKPWTEPCDYLACGFGLVPNTELAIAAGCELTPEGFVQVNERQETSVDHIYCAGEPTGIGGLDKAVAEGEAAGLAACGKALSGPIRDQGFERLLTETFRLREELRSITAPDTVICRCEDVPLHRIQMHGSWRAAKLQTRCGMGPCQGRICGPAVEFLMGWPIESVRLPVFPAKVSDLLR